MTAAAAPSQPSTIRWTRVLVEHSHVHYGARSQQRSIQPMRRRRTTTTTVVFVQLICFLLLLFSCCSPQVVTQAFVVPPSPASSSSTTTSIISASRSSSASSCRAVLSSPTVSVASSSSVSTFFSIQRQRRRFCCCCCKGARCRSFTALKAVPIDAEIVKEEEEDNDNGDDSDSTTVSQQERQHDHRRRRRRRHMEWLFQSTNRKVQNWMHHFRRLWQRTKRRNVILGAALCFSLLFASLPKVLDPAVSPTVSSSSSSSSSSLASTRLMASVASSNHRIRTSESRPISLASTMVQTSLATHTPLRGGSGDSASTATTTAAAARSRTTTTSTTTSSVRKVPSSSSSSSSKSSSSAVASSAKNTQRTMINAMQDLQGYMAGPKSDTLLLLLATALITPVCKRLGTSPILGFLASGMLLGPNGCGLISGIHTTETLAELGIVFFLFEMGIELSFERLLSMKRDVFGLGLSQFVVTSVAVAGVGHLLGLPGNALVVLGGGLALSSSAFVLQLLKDKNQLATRFGKASFGVLLFQDLAVVPLLVVTPILAGGSASGGVAAALGKAVIKAGMALGSIAFAGRVLLNPLFKIVAQAQSQEAFLGVILLTVLSMSFMTEGLGLSNTLGAFLAGVLLSETKYRYQVEADIAPFRGILLGLFFVTVGFEIDVNLILSQLPQVASLVLGLMGIKALIVTALSRWYQLSLSNSIQTGLILSQGGEFAFVAFGLARTLGILSPQLTKLLLTSVSLTMALTPLMSSVGNKIAKKLEEQSDFTHYLGQDQDANEIKESDDFVLVVGYGAVGKVVCDLLDRKFIKYVGLDINPNKAIQARNAGLPVFYGDIGRQEVAEAFNAGKAKAVIVCIAEKQQANRAIIALRRWYPKLKIFARAADVDHANRLQNTLDVVAMVPILPEDNLLLTLPFGGAVMKALGVPGEEVNAILENKRKDVLQGRGLAESEEEAALVQLGIIPDAKPPVPLTLSSSAANATDAGSARAEAASGRREQALQKSPFVAQVIEEVCPDSICEDDDEDGNSSSAVVEENATVSEEVSQESVVVTSNEELEDAAMKNETSSAFQ